MGDVIDIKRGESLLGILCEQEFGDGYLKKFIKALLRAGPMLPDDLMKATGELEARIGFGLLLRHVVLDDSNRLGIKADGDVLSVFLMEEKE